MATATAKGKAASSPLLRGVTSSRRGRGAPAGAGAAQPLRLGTTGTFESMHWVTQPNSQEKKKKKKGSSPPAKPQLSCSGEMPAVAKETGDCWRDLQRWLPASPSREGDVRSRVALHRPPCALLETGTPLHPGAGGHLRRGSSAAASHLGSLLISTQRWGSRHGHRSAGAPRADVSHPGTASPPVPPAPRATGEGAEVVNGGTAGPWGG